MQVELDVSNRSFPWGAAAMLLLIAVLLLGGVWWLLRTEPEASAPMQAQDVQPAEPTGSQGASAPSFQVVAEQPALTAASDADGTLWIGGVDGLYRIKGNTPERVLPTDEMPMTVHAVHVADDGDVYVGYTNDVVKHDEVLGWYLADADTGAPGTLRYDPATGEQERISDVPMWDFAAFGSRLYGITNDGVVAVDTGEHVGPPTTDDLLKLGFALLATDDHLYAGTFEGIWRWDGAQWEHVLDDPKHKGLAFARLDGTLYAAVGGRGIYESAAGTEWRQIAEGDFEHLVAVAGSLYAGGTDGVVRIKPTSGLLDRLYGAPIISLSTRNNDLVITTRDKIAVSK